MFSFKFIIIIVDLQFCIILCPLCCLAHLIDEYDHCGRQSELMINAPDTEFCKLGLISGWVLVLYSWVRSFTLTVALHPGVHMGNREKKNRRGNPAMDILHSI